MKKVLISLTVCAAALMAADGAAVFGSKCAACHGKDGKNSAIAGKVLAGQSAADIATKLAGYKDPSFGGAKKGMMAGPAKGLTDDDVKAIATYVATLK